MIEIISEKAQIKKKCKCAKELTKSICHAKGSVEEYFPLYLEKKTFLKIILQAV